MSSKLRVIVMCDRHTGDPTAYVYPLVKALLDRVQHQFVLAMTDDYFQAIEEVGSKQADADCVVVFLRSKLLFAHPGLFTGIRLPVVVVEHDAYQNSLEWHPNCGAWTRYFNANPVAALCVSGNTALRDLEGAIKARVARVAKGAPEEFLSRRIDLSGRFCLFGTVQLGMYSERRSIYDAIRPHTLYDRAIRKYALYGLAYFLSRLWRQVPDVSRIDFDYPSMPEVLRYYSAAIIYDRGLREPMMKHFEVAALGLAPFRDDECRDELESMGFKDGESMVVYTEAGDLREKMGHYARSLDELNAIQLKAREVTRSHTWERRAEEILGFVGRELV